MLLEAGFWICFGLVFYVYVGYPMLVLIIGQLIFRDVLKTDTYPEVTIVIAAFNEEQDIKQTVLNKILQDYPHDRLKVIVISDGSTDRTDQIVQELIERYGDRVSLLRQEPRQGKTQALNMAVTHATGEILVFSDANSMYAPDAVRKLVRGFADPEVGYITGHLIYTNPLGSVLSEGSGIYMKYESLVRKMETRLYSVIGVNGGIDAIRCGLYTPMGADQLPDFVLPLNVVEQNKRVVYEPDAKLYEPALALEVDEFRMRVRVSLRAIWALYDKRNLLNPFRNLMFSWQLFSHKVLRYGAFIPLIGVLIFNIFIVNKNLFYFTFFWLQLLSYSFAALGPLLSRISTISSNLLMPYYFVVLNLASAVACWKFLNGQKMVIWKPRVGN